MLRTCQKCNHANPSATGDALEACPECGAIYSRVAAALAAKAQGAPAPTAPAQPASAGAFTGRGSSTGSAGSFAERLRAESLYPTFRGLVRLIFFVWMALAALAFLTAAVALWSGSGIARVGGFIGGVFFAVFFAVVAKVTKEAALMLADLSDAAVHIAARMKP